MKTKLQKIAAALTIAFAASSAQAALILTTPEDFPGSGLGAVSTVLTISGSGSATAESGSVSFNGTTDVLTGDAKDGASQTLTRTLAEIGATSASALRVVFNAAEPGGANTNINLVDLLLSIYSPTGSLLFTSGAFTPLSFPNTFTGTGNSGFVFSLDATDAATAQSFFGTSTNRIGLSAAATAATGGNETFFVAVSGATTPPTPPGTSVPEPATLALLGVGLLGAAFAGRRTKKQ